LDAAHAFIAFAKCRYIYQHRCNGAAVLHRRGFANIRMLLIVSE